MAAYLHHITLNTGHSARSPRAEVADETMALMRPWVQRLASTGQRLPLPVPPLSHYSASITVDGGMLCSIYAPRGPHVPGKPHKGEADPLITMGVASRSRHGRDLWALMRAQFGGAEGLTMPGTPWLAVQLHPALAAHKAPTEWLADLERCIAWAWIDG